MDLARQPKAAVHLAMLINMLSIGSLMMVMPLGPDFVRALGMQASHVGYVAGGATLAAALSAAASAAWLDRLERKRALVCLLALRFALLLSCAMAKEPQQLIALFVLSGLVAGPMGAVLMAAVLDLVPVAERGRKLAYVAMGYSLAAIIVTPLALELVAYGGWQTPFLVCGGAGLLLAALCLAMFPRPADHARKRPHLLSLLRSPLCLGALAIVFLQMFGHFLLVPHFSNYFQFNLGFPRDRMGLLYLFGGLASLAAMHLGGVLIDRGKAKAVVLLSSGCLAGVTLIGFAMPQGLSLYLVFALFMALGAVRSSSTLTIAAAIPSPEQRAAFMALQSTVSNVAAGLGGLFSAAYLAADADRRLIGFDELAWLYTGAGIVAGAGVVSLLRPVAARSVAQAAGIPTKQGRAQPAGDS
ncbi:MFS transporter [Stutzerimonas stutzeri]|nr:MFS transporter [Stutzerimonas stutzeri]KXO83785.1 MFS transporter [Stutzerimonas stutzeri]